MRSTHNDSFWSHTLSQTLLEATVKTPRYEGTFDPKEGEYCPECNHAWSPDGPAHYSDCRYFSLDDDRDEEPADYLWAANREMAIGDRVMHITF